jgi:type I restriction enzyme S subunit
VNFSAEQKGKGVLVVDVFNMYTNDLFVRTESLYRVDITIPEERMLRPGDILFVRSSVKESGVGWPAIFKGHSEPVTNCGFIIRARQIFPGIEPGFLVHYLRQNKIRTQMISRSGKVAITNINQERLGSIEIPVPSLPEQRRIAEVLDRAEWLRAKRQTSLSQLDTLARVIFEDVFGDPKTNPNQWPAKTFESLLAIPLRNGLSPSSDGKVVAKVLTLAAITGSSFKPQMLKQGNFQSKPGIEDSVDEIDFLICRGNGNISLVGKGRFPSHTMSDTTFPDTIIAARVLPNKIDRTYLSYIWNSQVVRNQIEAKARTTNGTYKVNQAILEGIMVVVPPLLLQQEFARRIAAVEKLKAAHRASLAQLDDLFGSLQYLAFRGEL